MSNSSLRRATSSVCCAWVFMASSANAVAQTQPQGFAVERFYPSAPGAGWIVMDDLNLRGGLGGALSFAAGYSHNPLRLKSADGSESLALVRHQAFYEFGAAVTCDRFRIYLNASSPLVVQGDSGSFEGYSFPPGYTEKTSHQCGAGKRVCVDPGWNPDTIADPRIGFDARLYGAPGAPLRLGLSTQLYFPAGEHSDYLSDNTFRAMDRLLIAGDLGRIVYAAHVGAHFRLVNDSPAPGSPRGSELLFGLAAGPKLSLADGHHALIVGPELFGATAFRDAFGSKTTAVEALLTGRWEGTDSHGAQTRLKAGAGAGLHSEFGAPEWRAVIGIELFDPGR